MIIDALLQFSVSQAITSTAASSNVIDFGAAMDLGITERPTQVYVDWNIAPVGPGGATVTVALQSSPTGTGNWTTVEQTGALVVGNIAQGTTNALDLSPGMQRYAQLVYTVTGGPLTAGTVTAGLALDSDGGQKYYRRAY